MSERDMSEIEGAAGITPLDVLIAKHRRIRDGYATLWAKYGPGGVADSLRKAELSRIKELLRARRAGEPGSKVTEASLDDAAHDHPDYAAFLAMMLSERASFYVKQVELEEVSWEINRGQALLRHIAYEPR